MMATTAQGSTYINGITSPSPVEDEELYDQLLRLRDVVVAGKHTSFKLPASALAQLKASLPSPVAQAAGIVQPQLNGVINSTAFTTNQAQPQQSSSFHTFTGLPGLQTSSPPFSNGPSQVYGTKVAATAGLDPIFLEKSDSLVRAEGQLKRQRLERDLQAQVDQRKHASRDKDAGVDAPSPIDIDFVLLTALERVKPISGLKAPDKTGSAASSSFDENDYYSSQVQSDWSSDAGSSKGSDRAAGAFMADFERLDDAAQALTSHSKRSTRLKEPLVHGSSVPQPSKYRSNAQIHEPDDVYNPEEEDDEYTPPDATVSNGYQAHGMNLNAQQIGLMEDDNSDYEPGEITQDNNIPALSRPAQQTAHPSPRVPVIRNHLTHIAAPQPNRVSPLATAKGPSIELELVNGRPEIVQKPQQRSNYIPSRPSSASPSGNGVSGSGKKRRNKKRKRDHEPTGRSKRRRERNNAQGSPASPVYQEPYIKDEPMSPPPFANVPEVPQYARQHVQYRPAEIDLVSPRQAPQVQYIAEPPRSGLRYEYVQPTLPTVVRVASPSAHRPVQRDTQDLRRVASLHNAQRPSSPQRLYSPVGPYMNALRTTGEPRPAPISHVQPTEDDVVPNYEGVSVQDAPRHARAARSPSPALTREYTDLYAERAASPALMPPPPPSGGKRIVVDAYGHRYVAVDSAPAPAPAYAPRVSVAPVERRPQSVMAYERGPSRSISHAQRYQLSSQYEPMESRTAMPPPPFRRQAAPEQTIQYVDANGLPLREYQPRHTDSSQYTDAPTSPVYQQVRGYDQMPPPPQPAREPSSPIYVSRSYDARPEVASQIPSTYIRHASVAPVQYIRQEAPFPPARAVSVMPGIEYNTSAQPQRSYSQSYAPVPQNVRYVDSSGHEVFPSEVRQVSQFRYQ